MVGFPVTGSTWHTLPQNPQLLLSVFVSTQVAPQTVPLHDPLRQQEPGAQTVPQVPQLLLSVLVLTHVGKPLTTQTFGALLGQLQVVVVAPPGAWLVMTWQLLAPFGQQTDWVLVPPQLTSPPKEEQAWQVVIRLPQAQAPLEQTSY